MREQQPAGGARGAGEFVAAVRGRARRTLAGSAWMLAVAAALAVVLALGIADYLFRLPQGVRIVQLAVLVAGAVVLLRRVVLPALRFRPSLADVALRLERSEGGAPAKGRLASGVELSSEGGAGVRGELATKAAREADEAAMRLRGERFVRRDRLARAAALLGAVALVAVATSVARPDLARISIARTLWPFAKVDWPKRTGVADATVAAVHPIGESLPLRALVTKTAQPVGKTSVVAWYRVITPEGAGPVERAILPSQERVAEEGGERGELFERLIEPTLEGAEEGEIEYWFETEDDRTEARRIQLAARPQVVGVTASVRPPAYAAELPGTFLREEALEVSPDGQGVAAIGPILAGSDVRLSLRLNKPAQRGGAEPGWMQPDAQTLVFETLAAERSRTGVTLTDELGLASADALTIVLEVVEDAPAGVTVVEPAYDESVLATAVIPVGAEGRDDLGMEWLALERQVARPPAGSEGAPHEAAGPHEPFARIEAEPDKISQELRLRSELDLAVLGVRPGDEVWLTGAGRDAYLASPDAGADERTVRSAARRLRIIDELAFVEQIRGELAGVRKAAIEMDAEQGSIRSLAGEEFDAAQAADRQAALTERLGAQRETLSRLERRIERNALEDEALDGLVGDAAGLLSESAGSSAEAARELGGLSPEETSAGARAEAAQDRVRENLESLISMLDQGRDSWVARRSIESLLAEQRALQRETAALGDRTMGQSLGQLTPEDLTELERIAARQRDAAERARQALESLSDRAEMLRGMDPGQAQAMSQAAQRGRQERISDQMEQAAAQVGQNQTRAAAQGQQAAAEALEQMLGDMDAADSARDEALRRVLAGVIQSLDGLISQQEGEIGALAAAARAGGSVPALAEGMVSLATNTLGLLDEIGPQRDLATVVRMVGEAADAQQRAVVSLRAASAESAAEAEDESLAHLREARAEAQRLEEQAAERETSRQRAELRQAYRAMLEEQVAVAGETSDLVGVELDRRARAAVRGLGQRQDGISKALAELRRSTEALADASVFELAHARMDRSSGAAAESLLAGEADAAVQRRQATVMHLLAALVEALAEQKPSDSAFRDGQSGGGAGGSSGGDAPIIPELAELKLLRAMQAEAMEWTRNIDESDGPTGQPEMQELAELQRQLAERGEQLIEKLTQQPGAPQEGQVPQ